MLISLKTEPGSTLRFYAPLLSISSYHTLTEQRHSVSIEMRSSDSGSEEEDRERGAG